MKLLEYVQVIFEEAAVFAYYYQNHNYCVNVQVSASYENSI
jgi:hypothetical protein